MIIHKLLLLESEAQQAMRAIEKEQQHLFEQSKAHIATQTDALEGEKNLALNRLHQTIHTETTTAIKKIQANFGQKEDELKTAFAKHSTSWKQQVMDHMLFGDFL